MGMFASFHCREEKMVIKCNVFHNEYTGQFPSIEIAQGRNQIQIFPSFEQVKELHKMLGDFIESEAFKEGEKKNENHQRTMYGSI